MLQLVAEGKTTTAIAAALNLSEKTIETHRRQIMNKLGIYSVAGLTKFVVFGMPKVAYERGGAECLLPLSDIPNAVVSLLSAKNAAKSNN